MPLIFVTFVTCVTLVTSSVMRRLLLLRRIPRRLLAHFFDAPRQCPDLQFEDIDVLLLSENRVAQFLTGPLQEGELQLQAFHCVVCHVESSIVLRRKHHPVNPSRHVKPVAHP